MAAIYQYTTLGTVRQELANRLYDIGQVFWSPPELNQYLTESLRTFNALTGFWRGDFLFPLVQGTVWYDLTAPASTRPITVPLSYLVSLIEYMLLEPPSTVTGGTFNAWAGSLQFSLDDIIQAIARRRDEILSLTGCTQTESLIPAVAGRIVLPDTTIDIRRMAYIPSTLFPTQVASVMWQEDTWAEQSFNRTYLQAPAGTPFAYLLSTQPPISFDTDRPPAYAGHYDLLTVNAGAALSSSSAASTLPIPDDWTHVIVWGALADLLSKESLGKDVPRAQYSEQRYRMGIAALSAAPALLAMRINNVPLLIDAVKSADEYSTGWQASASGAPSACYHSGLNLLAFNNLAGGTPSLYGLGTYGTGFYGAGAAVATYSMTATVVENAPLPIADSDPFPCSRDDLDAIIDYSQHLAAFKGGGAEFLATLPLLSRFLKQCAVYNAKLAEMGEFAKMLRNVSQLEAGMNPVMTPAGESIRASVDSGGGSGGSGGAS